jgi:hypothetical protein
MQGTVMADIDLSKFLDKAHAGKPLAEVLTLSPAALKGVTDEDAKLLMSAFGIKTIADFGRNKQFRAAQVLVQLAEIGD